MDGKNLKSIAVLGAGAWGTALALYLARRKQTIRLWSIDKTEISELIKNKSNERFLPGFPFPSFIQPTHDLNEALHDVNEAIIAIPSAGFRSVISQLKTYTTGLKLICATKGLDSENLQLLSSVIEEILGPKQVFAILSGPSFAKEVAEGKPTAVSIACKDSSFRKDIFDRFHSALFGLQFTDDVIGVESGGIVKNVIAIASGIIDGMNLGSNLRSAIITLGFNEIVKLGQALGGRAETFSGLSGLGDLILTCSDNLSRNRRFGLAIGKGDTPLAAEKSIGQVIEGKQNAELVSRLANQLKIDVPVTDMVSAIIHGKCTIQDAINQLLETIR